MNFMFWVRVPGVLFTCVVIHFRRREPFSTLFFVFQRSLQYSFFDSSGCLIWLEECSCSTSRVMQHRKLVASKESQENSDFILYSIYEHSIAYRPTSQLRQKLCLGVHSVSSQSISIQSELTFHTQRIFVCIPSPFLQPLVKFLVEEIVLSYTQRKHRKACQRTLNLAVSERGVIIFNEFD